MNTLCLLCGSTNTVTLTLDKVYHHCENCDFIFMNPSHLIGEVEEKTRYLQHNNTMNNTGYVNMFHDFITNALEPKFAASEKILDFGCGPNPVFAQIMKDQGKKADVYDPFFFPNKIYQQKKYDIITLTEVLEHIQRPLSTLRPLITRLSADGLLAIMTRIHPGADAFEKWWYRMDNTHISFYSLKTAKALAKSLDMRMVKTDGERFFCLQP
ncbi:MAG: class I SAM-dependent methyltransferase [Thermotogota bacterium]